MRNLIICPVGNPLTFDDRYKRHWRYTDENRKYETLVFQYSDFVPEDNTYDFLIKKSGFKWSLAKEHLKTFDYSKYEYIGFLDDDLITDIESINYALEESKNKGYKLFQLSVTKDSDMFYPILYQKNGIKNARTNFIEVMGPFIHTSLIPVCQELWEKYDIYSGWGFDKVLCDLTKENATVFHNVNMYHPKKISSYNKSNAFSEMNKLTEEIFPKFMREKYNEEWVFKDQQKDLEIIMENL